MTLNAFFAPRHIVVVGASSNPSRVGGRPIAYLQKLGYAGEISPVNPHRAEIAGLPCYPTVSEVPGEPDLALIAVAGEAAVAAVDACGARGIRAAIVFTAGFAELGGEGLALQAALVEAAQRHGVRLCGPNTLGIISAPLNVAATFATSLDRTEKLESGRVGLISQSGALGAFMHREAQLQGIPVRHFVATGNEADLSAGDYLRYMIEDDAIRGVGVYLEGVRSGPSLVEGLERARELQKPVAVVKVGRGARARAAAHSHTGALAGEDNVIDAILRQYGALRLSDIDDLLAFLYLISSLERLPAGDRLGVVSLSGGLGVWASDVAEDHGVALADLAAETRTSLEAILPSFASVSNPVDVTGQVVNEPQLLAESIKIVAADPSVDTVVVGMGIQDALGDEIARGISAAANSISKPVVTGWMAGPEEAYARLAEGGVPTFRSVGRSLQAVTNLASWTGRKNIWDAQPRERRRQYEDELVSMNFDPTEFEGKQLLADVGIRSPRALLVDSADLAAAAISKLSGKVVMKAQVRGVTHKTDLGLVELGVDSAQGARDCYAQFSKQALSHGLLPAAQALECLVEEMIEDVVELILGYRRDDVFGPMVLLGLGGTHAELFRSFASRRCPIFVSDVESLIIESNAAAVLNGFRGEASIDRAPLINAVLGFSDFVEANEQAFDEIEINPLAVSKRTGKVTALDALVIPRKVSTPQH